jgi:hypothetical protein
MVGHQNLKKGRMVKTMPRMGKEWGLRFEIRPSSFSNGWKSILHLTTGGNCCKIGQRIPAFFWHTNKGNANQRSMHITFHRDGAGNAQVNSPLLAKNRWAKIKMSQRKISNKYIISIQVRITTFANCNYLLCMPILKKNLKHILITAYLNLISKRFRCKQ